MTNHAFQKLNRRKHPAAKRVCIGAAAATAFIASLTLTFTSLAATVYNVKVAGDPAQVEVHTFRKDPVRVIRNAGIALDDDDLYSVTSVNGGDNSNLVVYKSGQTSIEVDGQEHIVETNGSVASTIASSGITLDRGDTISVDLGSIAYDGLEINIDRAFDVFVEDGDDTYVYRTTGCKAGEAVYAMGLVLEEGDELSVAPETFLGEGDTVEVLRCSYRERTAEESIDFGTTIVRDNNLFEGQSRILSKGTYGTQEVVYRDKYLGASCVASEPIVSTVLTEPVNEVKAVGTRVFSVKGKVPVSNLPLPEGFELNENGVPANYTSYFDGIATAYYGGGITASGRPAAVGYVAVDPKVIPYGTELWVASLDGEYVYGYAIAADTGGFVKGGWADMDLYMDTESECWQFGIRGVRIYIL